MNKTAKEMFEELGYSALDHSVTIDYYKDELQIRFWKTSKEIELFGGECKEFDLENFLYFNENYKLFIAINKQIEELGWNE